MERVKDSTDIYVWFNYQLQRYQLGVEEEFIASGENLNEVADFSPILRFSSDKMNVAVKITKELNDAI